MTTEKLNIIIGYARLTLGIVATMVVIYMYISGRVQLQEMLAALGVLMGLDRAAAGAQSIGEIRRK